MKSLLIGLSVFMSISAFAAMEDIKEGQYTLDSMSGSNCGDILTTLGSCIYSRGLCEIRLDTINIEKKNNEISIKEYGFKNAKIDNTGLSKIFKHKFTDMEWIIKSHTTISEVADGILVEMNGVLKRPVRAIMIDIFSVDHQPQRIDGTPFDQKLEIIRMDSERVSVAYSNLVNLREENVCTFKRVR